MIYPCTYLATQTDRVELLELQESWVRYEESRCLCGAQTDLFVSISEPLTAVSASWSDILHSSRGSSTTSGPQRPTLGPPDSGDLPFFFYTLVLMMHGSQVGEEQSTLLVFGRVGAARQGLKPPDEWSSVPALPSQPAAFTRSIPWP